MYILFFYFDETLMKYVNINSYTTEYDTGGIRRISSRERSAARRRDNLHTTVILEQTRLREPSLKGCVQSVVCMSTWLCVHEQFSRFDCSVAWRLPETSSWCSIGQFCQVVQDEAIWTIYRTEQLDIALRKNLPWLVKMHPTHTDIITTRCLSCGFGSFYITSYIGKWRLL